MENYFDYVTDLQGYKCIFERLWRNTGQTIHMLFTDE
jgi:hypothetical protein